MIRLFTTGCPKCKVLKGKLDSKGILYETFTDVDAMIQMGITSAPMLEVDGKKLDFPTAIQWINKQGE